MRRTRLRLRDCVVFDVSAVVGGRGTIGNEGIGHTHAAFL